MLCIAAAYYYLNRADPDCGTTFTWVSKAMGPKSGWTAGWAIIVADVLVMPSLAFVAGQYSFQLFGWDAAAGNKWAILAVGIAWIVVMTWICWVGVELSARTQQILLSIEIFTLCLFAVVALYKVYAQSPPGSIEPALSWFNPFDISSVSALTGGVLLGVFIYWGWDSGVAVNEESEDPASGPGKSAIVSTLILVGIYVLVTTAAQAFAGPQLLIDNPDDIFAPLGESVLGSGLDKLLIIAVLTSASASTQTTILPTARTSLSMARSKAMPAIFGRIHPRYLSPDVSTLAMGGVSGLVFFFLIFKDENLVFDAFTALGLMICFYYGLTGFACTIYYRQARLQEREELLLHRGAAHARRPVARVRVRQVGDRPACRGLGLRRPVAGSGCSVHHRRGGVPAGRRAPAWRSIVRYPEFFSRKASVVDPSVLESAPAGGGGS